jgi:hypothetical protein
MFEFATTQIGRHRPHITATTITRRRFTRHRLHASLPAWQNTYATIGTTYATPPPPFRRHAAEAHITTSATPSMTARITEYRREGFTANEQCLYHIDAIIRIPDCRRRRLPYHHRVQE